ncbi:hypothetical protein OROMI_025414 [Orobanche minor]
MKPQSVPTFFEQTPMASKSTGHLSFKCLKPTIAYHTCGITGHHARFCRGGLRRTPLASHAPVQSSVQDRAPTSASHQTTGANRGIRRGSQTSKSGNGATKPRIYEIKRVDDPEASMIAAFHGDNPSRSGRIISTMKAVKLLNHGCVGYLCNMTKTMDRPTKLANIPVVRDYPDVFPDVLSGLPPHSEEEFTIELEPVIDTWVKLFDVHTDWLSLILDWLLHTQFQSFIFNAVLSYTVQEEHKDQFTQS